MKTPGGYDVTEVRIEVPKGDTLFRAQEEALKFAAAERVNVRFEFNDLEYFVDWDAIPGPAVMEIGRPT